MLPQSIERRFTPLLQGQHATRGTCPCLGQQLAREGNPLNRLELSMAVAATAAAAVLHVAIESVASARLGMIPQAVVTGCRMCCTVLHGVASCRSCRLFSNLQFNNLHFLSAGECRLPRFLTSYCGKCVPHYVCNTLSLCQHLDSNRTCALSLICMAIKSRATFTRHHKKVDGKSHFDVATWTCHCSGT